MGMSGSRQESAYTSISRCRSGLANTPPWQTDHYPQVVRWTQASGTTGGKGEVPSQGSRPISSLFSCRQLAFCYGAGQQDSSEYSLAKEGWPRHQVNGPVPLEARTGWFVQLPIIGGLNQPPHLRALRRLRDIFLMGAATPPCPRRGLRLSLQLFSNAPVSRKRCGTSQAFAKEGSLDHPTQSNAYTSQVEGAAVGL